MQIADAAPKKDVPRSKYKTIGKKTLIIAFS